MKPDRARGSPSAIRAQPDRALPAIPRRTRPRAPPSSTGGGGGGGLSDSDLVRLLQQRADARRNIRDSLRARGEHRTQR